MPSVTDNDDLSEDAIVSEPELEYDENVSIEESDLSGSEFQPSEDDFEVGVSSEEEDDQDEYVAKPHKSLPKQSLLVMDEHILESENDDEIMLDAAIRESLQTARLDNPSCNGAGSSSRASASSNPAAALRAAAAERRLARANQTRDIDDCGVLELNTLGSDAQSSSDEELLSKAKGKGKAKMPKKLATVYDTTSNKFMSISQRRKLNREQRKLAAASRRGNRKEELAMMKLLGRKLTYVRFFTASSVSEY